MGGKNDRGEGIIIEVLSDLGIVEGAPGSYGILSFADAFLESFAAGRHLSALLLP